MDLKAKIAAVIGVLVGVLRVMFPHLPAELNDHLMALLDACFFVFAFFARGGLVFTQGVTTKTRITAVTAFLIAGVRIFFTIPPELETSFNTAIASAYTLVGIFLHMAGEKSDVAAGATRALKSA